MKKIIFLFCIVASFYNCKSNEVLLSVAIKNSLNIDREFETVEVDISALNHHKLDYFIILDENKKEVTSQLIDTDLDGKMNVLIFQPSIKANSTKRYTVAISDIKQDSVFAHCYSRFVPERTDDYAWENNRVAFRTFGPVAQKMIEEGVKGGTLSSGMDAWLKRVEYPIINKWYDKTTKGIGSYHKDTGEGLDNFHVGVSRGVGGIAVKVDTSYYFSKNFTDYKTITSGPIRTSFILNYETWDANGNQIEESKLISLDYGQNLSRFEIIIKGTDSISAGLTLHKKDGIIAKNKNWISYWEPFDDSELGQGLVTTDAYFINSEKYVTSKKDESNLYMNLRVVNNKVIYYAGFGWKKSNQFKNKQEWESYLKAFSDKINTPLLVKNL
ncbi:MULTISPECIES: DUF4861 family protein [unclassified Polaribacter]|uniref:DUF4861 family protein n=1 Tax=unclassified Polaribacter TaxID=196858 RepID=UPI0011BF1852|nr:MULTISPECIES: DUF4861 family protein [unclassified Polaribacter]TXD50428.1 DUF4861 domain-containing protein [Polaribacter sp. IC063]TXD57814.1 DUF4861 domain-containing protein [Polaribacter sp. IC066]